MYICIYVYMYICIYVYVCMYMYICIYIYVYVYMCICIYVYIYIYIYVYMYICIYVYVYVYIYIYIYIYIYVYIYICICVYIYVYVYICIYVYVYIYVYIYIYVYVYIYICIYICICIYIYIYVYIYICIYVYVLLHSLKIFNKGLILPPPLNFYIHWRFHEGLILPPPLSFYIHWRSSKVIWYIAMMICKRPMKVPQMLCVPIYNMKLAMMQKTLIFTTFSAHTKMAADKRGQIRCLPVIGEFVFGWFVFGGDYSSSGGNSIRLWDSSSEFVFGIRLRHAGGNVLPAQRAQCIYHTLRTKTRQEILGFEEIPESFSDKIRGILTTSESTG